MGFLDRWRQPNIAPPPPGPLADLAACPPPDLATPLLDVELLAIDLETTGLDPKRDELLSFGYLPVIAREIQLSGARHLPVKPVGQVGDSATVHGLTDDLLSHAPPVAEVLPEVLRALVSSDGRQRVLLAHFADIEVNFIATACLATYSSRVVLPVIDTLQVQFRSRGPQLFEPPPRSLRLNACRREHNLPRYRAHNATVDALACAELFLAQWAELEERRGRPLLLGDVVEPVKKRR